MSELAKASKLFSRKFIESLIWNKRAWDGSYPSKEYQTQALLNVFPYYEKGDTWDSLGKRILNQMCLHYRNEYVLKSELYFQFSWLPTLNEILVAGQTRGEWSRTDFIVDDPYKGFILYEIKSERDSLARLEKQLLDYVAVFEHVRILVDEKKSEKMKTFLTCRDKFIRVGLYTSPDTAIWQSEKTPLEELDFDKIFYSLLQVERRNLSDKTMYSERKIKDYWDSLSKAKAYEIFKRSLIARKYNKGTEWLEQIPEPFRPLCWKFRDLDKQEKEKLIRILNESINLKEKVV